MVAPAIIGAGIMAGASLAGTGLSMLGRGGGGTPDNSTFYQNWRNDDMAWAREQFDRNEALQREFAQNGLAWRVQDARNAGLHPLAAIGAQGASAAPISVGGGGQYNVDFGRSPRDDTGQILGRGLSDMGQNIGRAYMASQPPEAKVLTAFELARQAQQLEHGSLQNEYIKLQIARAARPGAGDSGGGGVMTGPQVMSGQFENKPAEIPPSDPTNPAATAGTYSENKWHRTPNGGWASSPASHLNIDEPGSPGYFGYMWRNGLMPYLSWATGDKSAAPGNDRLPRGAIGWVHHFGEWYPKYPSRDFSHLPARPGAEDYQGYYNPRNYRR